MVQLGLLDDARPHKFYRQVVSNPHRELLLLHVPFYKDRSILVPKIPKIATRCRFSATKVKLEFRIFCEKSRQSERSFAICSLDVNKVSRIFSEFFAEVKLKGDLNKVSRTFFMIFSGK